MQKIHKISYGDYFTRGFKTSTIDSRMSDLELNEKLMIIDKVIDYIHEDLGKLSPPSTRRLESPFKSKNNKSRNDSKDLTDDKQSKSTGWWTKQATPKKVKTLSTEKFAENLQKEALQAKLKRKGIIPSNALYYKGLKH